MDRNSYKEEGRPEHGREELDTADMVRTFRIINGNDKVNKEIFWEMEEARQGAGRRRFKVKDVKRTGTVQHLRT